MQPVTGQILVNGKPCSLAMVYFYPVDRSGGRNYNPYAKTDKDGNFQLSSFTKGDGGAPAGEYIVTAIWPDEYRMEVGEEVPKGDKLGRKYENPKTSPVRVTIRDGENKLEPINLTN